MAILQERLRHTELPGINLRDNHQAVTERFAAAGRADERVVAATLCGSYARGAADAYSDLDLGLITTDEAHEEFVAGRARTGDDRAAGETGRGAAGLNAGRQIRRDHNP